MRVGFSLSPGGLLLPYHLGVLDGLQHAGMLTPSSPIAGASAGAIAAASHACSLSSKLVLDATISISDQCKQMGGARGRLLPLLREKLDHFIDDENFELHREREGELAIAYRELFPFNRAVHQTDFEHRHDLMNAVCHSSTFPFFSSNMPFAIDTSTTIPRVVVDGFFAVPKRRFGCPDFELAGVDVDHTVLVSPFPKEITGLEVSENEDCICPESEGGLDQINRLFRLATMSSSAKELIGLYDAGYEDAENWVKSGSLEKAKETANLVGAAESEDTTRS
jgi:predicted acylesterase/phospholipase RssA